MPLLDLPTDRPRDVAKTYQGSSMSVRLPLSVGRGLKNMANEKGASVFMITLALVKVFLYKYSGQTDIIVGSPVAGRDLLELEDQIGFYVNTLPIRSRFDGNSSFSDLLDSVRKSVLDAFEHQSYPFDKLVNELSLPKEMSRSPLFDVFVTTNIERSPQFAAKKTFEVTPHDQQLGVSKFDLSFYFTEHQDFLTLDLEYSTDLFVESTIARMSRHFIQLAANVIEQSDQPIGSLPVVTAEEQRDLLYRFNDLNVKFPEGKLIHELFEQQVLIHGGRVAVADDSMQWTYSQLNAEANLLARCLREKFQLKPGQLVGLVMERSAASIISILGILKAGGAYVPIDPEYPQPRIDYMLKDAAVSIVVKSAKASHIRIPSGVQSVEFGTDDLSGYADSNPAAIVSENNCAYVIYTSGSTGDPKGVVITHRNLVRLIENEKFPYDFDENDRWLLFHSISFDVSVWEIFCALFKGAALYITSADTLHAPEKLYAYIVQHGITILNQVPSVFYTFGNVLQEKALLPHRLRYVLFAGESLNPSLLRWWRNAYPACRLINMYGITETTIHVTFREVDDVLIDEGV
ncbi:MAG: non-ribosomal peptide synthetase, partial [Flammeovirgaceae bacterium]